MDKQLTGKIFATKLIDIHNTKEVMKNGFNSQNYV